MSLFSATETGFFARMSRARRPLCHLSCLHEQVEQRAYGEQRERGRQSLSCLLIWAPQPASENGGIYVTDKEFEHYSQKGSARPSA